MVAKAQKNQITALILAAGRGTRARQGDAPPKQYRTAGGGAVVLAQSLHCFAAHRKIDRILPIIHPDDQPLYQAAAIKTDKLLPPVMGGKTRQESVLNGLLALEKQTPPDLVLIHDAARPFVSPSLIDGVIDALATHDAALPVLDATDTIKQISADGITTLPRENLKHAQTPQGFAFDKILPVHKNAASNGTPAPDDAALAETAGLSIALTAGDTANIKLTTQQDFANLAGHMHTHTAMGFDVHRFGAGDAVRLGGVKIPHSHSLIGHSDADVVLHALTDALLGTLGAGDIGTHFPPDDPTHKNRDSADFLRFSVEKITEAGGQIIHLDVTLICEAPKIAPHRETMQARIGEICGLTANRVSIKATTTEKLGFTGRGEGIAAQAIASVRLPNKEI